MGLWNEEMKYETNVIAIITYLRSVAFKRCMTSPSYINRLFVSSRLIWRLGFVCSKLQSVAVMTSSRKYLLEDEIEQGTYSF